MTTRASASGIVRLGPEPPSGGAGLSDAMRALVIALARQAAREDVAKQLAGVDTSGPSSDR